MSRLVFLVLLTAYTLLIGGTGAFAAYMALGSNAPPPQVLEQISALDDATQERLWGALARAEDKQKKLSEIATNGFQVTLGALIGFLSAVGSAARKQESSTPKDGAPNGQAARQEGVA